MLSRQKLVLALLLTANRPLSKTHLAKLCFLLGQESLLSNDDTFYDFVPYRFGPFSFAMIRELDALVMQGYVGVSETAVYLREELRNEVEQKVDQLSQAKRHAASVIYSKYGGMSHDALLSSVYQRYPWFATRSELHDLKPAFPEPAPASLAVYTIGYEGRSVDGFFDRLLRKGISAIIDVRANPISRKYGFSSRALKEIGARLSIHYHHFPQLGIPGAERTATPRQVLLDQYAARIRGQQSDLMDVTKVLQCSPSALLCMERDINCCHRQRLAEAVSTVSGLPIHHI